MIEVLEPVNELLRRFVDSVYVFEKGAAPLEFTAYPGTNTPVGLFRDVTIAIAPGTVCIESADSPNHVAVACNLFTHGVHVKYRQLCDEIAINFKPLGFSSFSHVKPREDLQLHFNSWDEQLPGLFRDVFASSDPRLRLQCIEAFLLAQYVPLPEETKLLKALELLNDVTTDCRMAEIASVVGLHYKRLYRLFTEHVGCSMVHYRALVKFRASVFSKLDEGEKTRLVDICYENGYTDQAYFIRQFRQLTGKKPGHFFRKLVAFGKKKVVFRME